MDIQTIEGAAIPMPPKVAAAVSAVMGKVKAIAKDDENKHGSYNFASIDAFLGAVGPLCAESGLIIVQDELSFDIKDKWLVMKFSFTLAHSSGETWAHRPTRTVMVLAAMGPQAFGAAQSYTLKQFERSLFQIPTGDAEPEVDTQSSGELPATSFTPKQASAIFATLENNIKAAKTMAALGEVWTKDAEDRQKLSRNDRDDLGALKDQRKGELLQTQTKPQEAAPSADDPFSAPMMRPGKPAGYVEPAFDEIPH